MFTLLVASVLAADPIPPDLEENELQLGIVTKEMLGGKCREGEAIACHRLGRRYEQGIGGVEVAYGGAAAWFRRGCDGGLVLDCGLAAAALARTNEASAWTYATKGCEASEPYACFVVGHLMVVGLGTPANPAAGLPRVEKACADGIAAACAGLGQFLAGAVPNVATDYARARPLLEKSCAEKDLRSCQWLAVLLMRGADGPADPARGVKILEDACGQGSADACDHLAAVYLQGEGVPPDANAAVPWLQKACDGRKGAACAHLGVLQFQGGGGLTPDRAKAVAYLRRACEYGEEPACQELRNACRSGARDACD